MTWPAESPCFCMGVAPSGHYGLFACKFCGAGFYTREERASHEPYCRPWESTVRRADLTLAS